MEIQKIKASSDFNHRYIQINDSVLSFNYALFAYPEKTEEIKSVHYFLDYRNAIPVTKKFIFPSIEVMQQEVDKSCNNIIKKLDLKASKKPIEQFKAVYKIHDYFTNTLTYSMLAQEERGHQFEDNNYYLSALKQSREKLREFNLKPAPAPTERLNYKTQKQQIYKEMAKDNELFKNSVTFSQEKYLKSLYNVFVRNVGVCSDFSNANMYILNKLNIKSYKVTINKFVRDEELFHAYNLIEFDKAKTKGFYACDLTRSVCHKQKYNKLKEQNIIFGFGMGSEQLEDIDNTKILSIQKYNDDLEKEFFPEIEEDILEKDLSEELITKLITSNIKATTVEAKNEGEERQK